METGRFNPRGPRSTEQAILARLDVIETKLESAERAIYGDEKNKVTGVLEEVQSLKEIVETLKEDHEANRNKLNGLLAGVGLMSLGVLANLAPQLTALASAVAHLFGGP